mmetsp:Transcript_78569/g.202347  ORF Transcript_78569/g.202347 Transcript_78569/m.202347 type:complete len:90 (+) Transcript_78569:460-729(+)
MGLVSAPSDIVVSPDCQDEPLVSVAAVRLPHDCNRRSALCTAELRFCVEAAPKQMSAAAMHAPKPRMVDALKSPSRTTPQLQDGEAPEL